MRLLSWFKNKVQTNRRSRTSSVTVRYMFPAFLGTAILLGAAALTSTSQSFVILSSPTTTVKAGEVFSVKVSVSAHVPINAVDILVDFPEKNLQVFSVDRGQSVLTIWTQDPIITKKSVQLVGGTFKRGFIGIHQIATIKFRALATGQYTVSTGKVTFVAGDGSGTEIAVSKSSTNSLSLFNFDANTSPEDMRVAIAAGITTDINNDGKITLQDISAFMGAWSNKSQFFDFDGDNQMTFVDFSIILSEYFFQ